MKALGRVFYNTIKVPHRYDVQVSDTTMMTNDDQGCFFARTIITSVNFFPTK